jgi:hypothetical protein
VSKDANAVFDEIESILSGYSSECDASSVSLDQACIDEIINVLSFRLNWLENNKSEPEKWPLKLSADNAGLFHEQIHCHSEEGESS